MKFNLDKISNIKTKKDLESFKINKPIFYNNYLFHYLIILDKLDILKMERFPVYEYNEENLNGFMLAAKYDNIKILRYLLNEYPEYSSNHNSNNLNFLDFMTDSNKIIKLIDDYPNLDWDYLMKYKNEKNINKYEIIISDLSLENIKKFISRFPNYEKFGILYGIVVNDKITIKDKINLFDTFKDEDLILINVSQKDHVLLFLFEFDEIELFKYFINRNINLNVIIEPSSVFISLFNFIYNQTCSINQPKKYEMLEIFFNRIKDNIDYNYVNGKGMDYINMVLTIKSNHKIIEIIENHILKNAPDESFNKPNINKTTNLFLITQMNFNKYHKYLINRKVDLDFKYKNEKLIDIVSNEWKDFLLKLKPIDKQNIKIDIDEEKYQHYTLFRGHLDDIALYFIYLSKKHKNLFIPKISIDKINDNKLLDINEMPWFIAYNYDNDSFQINNTINIQINNVRRSNLYDYGLLFLSLKYSNNLYHANILLYDFKKLTIERFEPFGSINYDDKLDSILEEELTWNTGFKYLSPDIFLPQPAYQLLSRDNVEKKIGDFGGFCLAWCLWYVEHRIKHPNIESKILNLKTLEKLLKSENYLDEFIRNYGNKLVSQKYKLLKQLNIENKEISDINMNNKNYKKVVLYTNNYFKL